jgi:hypothetical protein
VIYQKFLLNHYLLARLAEAAFSRLKIEDRGVQIFFSEIRPPNVGKV